MDDSGNRAAQSMSAAKAGLIIGPAPVKPNIKVSGIVAPAGAPMTSAVGVVESSGIYFPGTVN